MSHRRLSIVAWFVWVAGVALMLGAAALSLANHPEVDFETLVVALAQGTAFLAIGAVGLLLATRRSHNAIGWVYLGVWLGSSSIAWVASFSLWATVTNPGVVGGEVATWLNNWLWVPTVGALLTFPLLLFPDGHLPSPRWRPFAWATVALIAAWSATFAFEGADYSDASVTASPTPTRRTDWSVSSTLARTCSHCSSSARSSPAVGSLVVRFRRGSALERAQIKWLILAGAVSVAFLQSSRRPRWRNLDRRLRWAGGGASTDLRGDRNPSLPTLRNRPDHQSHGLLRTGDRSDLGGLPHHRDKPEPGAAGIERLGRSSRDPGRGDAVSTVAFSSENGGRPEVQPGPLRRGADGRVTSPQRLRDGVDPDAVAVDLVDSVTRTVEPASISVWVRQP